ncbi:MAG TPA: DUF559 domain-containing protein [Xanthobacteraceae bacterium]|nr:DUF559 domain-containing protein [Xanthobacteraceae bacterium]
MGHEVGPRASELLLPSPREQGERWGGDGGGGLRMLQKQKPRKSDARVRRARQLRRSMTDAERKLWWYLRQFPNETSHFRRQATIGPYFVGSPAISRGLSSK